MENQDFNIEEHEAYAKKLEQEIISKEQKGKEEIIKYFDRIHDKLFSVNSILIGGYLALIAFKKDVPKTILFVPMVNFLILVIVDLMLLKKSRSEANYGKFTIETVHKYGDHIERINLWSFLSLFLTIVEMVIFTMYVKN